MYIRLSVYPAARHIAALTCISKQIIIIKWFLPSKNHIIFLTSQCHAKTPTASTV